MLRPAPAAAGGVDGPRTDATLLARLAARDEQALEEVSGRFGATMHAVALRVTRAERLAEEVVQDALMAVWREPARFDPARGNLGPWLLTLTRYKAIDAIRREAVVRRHTADVDLELREAPDDVHDKAWLGIRRQRLVEAIARLPDDQRRALELAFVAGLTHVEVADREGIPLGTAKTRIRAALVKLRHDLAPTIGPEVPRLPRAPGAAEAAAASSRPAGIAGGAIPPARSIESLAAPASLGALREDPPHGGKGDV